MKTADLIKSDYYRYWGIYPSWGGVLLKLISNKNHCFSYQVWLRLSDKSFIRPFARLIHIIMSSYYGIHIPPHTKIDAGLYINHGFGIFINANTVIGKNCNLSQLTTIGSNQGTPAVIGDNVYIGPSVCIVESVKIGNDVTIGAGSVVTKSFPQGMTVAGVPAKVISDKKHNFIQNKIQ